MKKVLRGLCRWMGILPIPLGEAADRLSILEIKSLRTGTVPPAELESYQAHLGNEVSEAQLEELERVNGQIWDLEADLRNGQLGTLTMAQVGFRALAIRDLNKERVRIKNEINEATGWYAERKVDHASA